MTLYIAIGIVGLLIVAVAAAHHFWLWLATR